MRFCIGFAWQRQLEKGSEGKNMLPQAKVAQKRITNRISRALVTLVEAAAEVPNAG